MLLEECVIVRMEASVGNLLQDLRFTFRQLGKTPSFAVTAVLTLALGIGANTAIFSLVNTILLKPLPVENPGQITALAMSQDKGPTLGFFPGRRSKRFALRASARTARSLHITLAWTGWPLRGSSRNGL